MTLKFEYRASIVTNYFTYTHTNMPTHILTHTTYMHTPAHTNTHIYTPRFLDNICKT